MFATHAFEPVYDRNSEVLILGTMPSPQSVRFGFYYSHPKNRFWPLMATLFQEPTPMTKAEKTAFLLRHHIALWDVLASCEIKGASDASIRNPTPNDFTGIFRETSIRHIYTTGKTAYGLFQKHVAPKLHRDAIYLPSTSPANQALYGWDNLLAYWREKFVI